MCFKRLVVISDPSTFEAVDPYKYFQIFMKFIRSLHDIWPLTHFLLVDLKK